MNELERPDDMVGYSVDSPTMQKDLEAIFTRLLSVLDPYPNREGLQQTPHRAARAWAEWTSGYDTDISSMMTSFEDGHAGYDELVCVHNIRFESMCEHHLAPIIGYCHFGYLPGDRIVGLSKIPRLVAAFARRLQVQERLTVQVADTFMEALQPRGVGVIMTAEHLCMSTRGIRLHGSTTTTSCMRGLMKDDRELREEFLALCQMAHQ